MATRAADALRDKCDKLSDIVVTPINYRQRLLNFHIFYMFVHTCILQLHVIVNHFNFSITFMGHV